LKLTSTELTDYIGKSITEFHLKRIEKIKNIKLNDVIRRKNPYMFKAKGIETAEQFVRAVIDAYISSSEETLFGDFSENLARFICESEKNGYKSSCEGIDIEFTENNIRYLVSLKSGPNWGNSSQVKKMIDNFKKAIKTLRTQNQGINIRCVNGCCYGKDNCPDKGEYLKYCGEVFWYFVSGEQDFYLKILKPLEKEAKEKNKMFVEEYAKIVNLLTKEFLNNFCKDDGTIDWEMVVKFNSAARI